MGQEVYSSKGYASAGNNVMEKNFSHLADGMYYYAIEHEKVRMLKKMVISK
jgi:hypothetical protein